MKTTQEEIGTKVVNLPLLVLEWVKKEYPGKCCISISEVHDIVMDKKVNKESDTLSALNISPNAKANSAPDAAYLIGINEKAVWAYHYVVLPILDGHTLMSRVQTITTDLDHRNPQFFENLAKEIGCQCKKQKR